MSIQERSGDLGVDFVSHEIRVPDCAVEILEEKGSKKLDREGRNGIEKTVALFMSSQILQFVWCLSITRIKRQGGIYTRFSFGSG